MLWVAVRQRRLDPFALFLLALFGAGFALSFTTGDARFILARDAAMSCVAGLVLVGSCIIDLPLVSYAAQRFARSAGAAQHKEFQATATTAAMRARWFRVSLVWGISLLGDVALRIAAIYLLPIGLAANVSRVLMVAVYGALLVWTLFSAKKAQAAGRTPGVVRLYPCVVLLCSPAAGWARRTVACRGAANMPVDDESGGQGEGEENAWQVVDEGVDDQGGGVETGVRRRTQRDPERAEAGDRGGGEGEPERPWPAAVAAPGDTQVEQRFDDLGADTVGVAGQVLLDL